MGCDKKSEERKEANEQKVERRRVLCFVYAAIATVIFSVLSYIRE